MFFNTLEETVGLNLPTLYSIKPLKETTTKYDCSMEGTDYQEPSDDDDDVRYLHLSVELQVIQSVCVESYMVCGKYIHLIVIKA